MGVGKIVGRLIAVSVGLAFALAPCPIAEAAIARSGALHQIVTDNFRTGQSTSRYILRSGKRQTVVRPTRLAAEPGDHVGVAGRLWDGRLVGAVQATDSAEELTPGPRKAAAVLVTFPGEPEEPWDPEETRSNVFTAADSANAFYQEESYGEISLTGELDPEGDVFGWLPLEAPTDECQFLEWKEKAEAAAAEKGIDLSGYQHVIYFFPHQSSCAWLGISEVGGEWAMINGDLGVHPIAHELGHNLGLEHAGSWTCTSGGIRVQVSDECTLNEYGDPFDVMGNIAPRHSNGWNLDNLGILAPENVETIEASGSYSMRAALARTTEPTLLRIPRTRSANGSVSSWYLLEVRQTGGVFENVTDASTTGVSIRVSQQDPFVPSNTILIDANPATASFADAPFGVGQTFEGGAVRVTTEAAGGGSATVSVGLDEEPPTAPTNLTATAGVEGVQLHWSASSDNIGVDRYVVYRDGVQVGTSSGTGFLDSFAPAGEHTYVVYAEDETRNLSDGSEPATATLASSEGPTCSGGTCAVSFWSSGALATWTVPAGVGQAGFSVEGAQGGGPPSQLTLSDRGARVVATLGSLTTGETATVSVGGMGKSYAEGGAGGFGGGGDGTLGAGGGGYSSVRLGSTLMLLAGGGGGTGSAGFNAITGKEPKGGTGGRGGEFGVRGSNGVTTQADEATLGGGAGGEAGGDGGFGGKGGEVNEVSNCPDGAKAGAPGAPGSDLTGGGGAPGGGGGGGGGYVGGGQGGGGASDECGSTAGAGGGGGGSSFAVPGLSASFTGGIKPGYGRVSLAYPDPIGATARSYTTLPDHELAVPAASGVLAGVSAPPGVPLSASIVSSPAHGSLTLDVDGSFAYTPTPGYSGADSFIYQAADPTGDYASALVALTVAVPPTASISAPSPGGTYTVGEVVPSAISCSEGAGGTGLLSCDDSNGAKTKSGGSGRLDTSAPGPHAYTVTAVSKDGLAGETSIDYTVVPVPEPPTPPDVPPSGPGPQPPEVSLFLRARGESLSQLRRTRTLALMAKVNKPAKVELFGRARLESPHRARPRVVALFDSEALDFAGVGQREVTLKLSRKGREALSRLTKLRLEIVGRATAAGGETATRTLPLTLR